MSKTYDLPLQLFQVLEDEYHSLYGPLPAGPTPVYLPDKGDAAPPSSFPPVARGGGAAPEASGEKPPAAGHGWRPVESERDWLFRLGHVKDPVVLAAALVPQELLISQNPDERVSIPADLAQSLPTAEWSRENLKKYIYHRIDRGLLAELRALHADGERREPPRELVGRLEAELNKFLGDPHLYHPDHFAGGWVGPTCRNFIALRNSLRRRKVRGALGGLRLRVAVRLARRGSETAESFRHEEDLMHFNRVLLEDAFPELERVFDVRFAAVCQHLHKARPTALSLSGGGIRSGTFALGLLQGLARHDLLKSFDYLSTVSGGGYIGGWLTAWLHRHPEGLAGVTRDLANYPPARRVDPDPPPLLHLRNFSSFLTPKVGLLTADTWTFVGMYFRNLLINWMVFIPLLVAVLLLPRLLLAATLAQPVHTVAQAEHAAGVWWADFVSPSGRHAFLALGYLLGVWALGYIDFNRPGLRKQLLETSRFWRHRSDQRHFIKWCLAPLLLSGVFLTIYFAWSSEFNQKAKGGWPLLLFGLAFILGGGAVSSLVLRRWRGGARGGGVGGGRARKTLSKYWIGVALLAAGALAGLLFFAISHGNFDTPVINYDTPDAELLYMKWSGWSAWKTELYVCLAVPAFLLVFWGATTFFVGVSSVSSAVSDEDREWWSRLGAWLIIAAMAWAAGAALVIFGPILLLSSPKLLAAAGGLSGLLALLAGRSAKTPGHKQQEAEAGAGATIMGKLLPLLAVVFLAAFVAALSLGTSYLIPALAGAAPSLLEASRKTLPHWMWLNTAAAVEWLTNAPTFGDYLRYLSPHLPEGDPYAGATRAKLLHMSALHHTSVWYTLGLALLLGAVGGALSRVVNLNIFSLHGGYRNRLIRAFLGASRPDGERRPNPFTGFDPEDNVPMHALRPGLLDEDDISDAAGLKARLLAAAPQSQTDPAALRLAQRLAPFLDRTRDASDGGGGTGLTDALRTDLNRALVELSLYAEFADDFMRTRRAREIVRRVSDAHGGVAPGKEGLRTDYHTLLNRLVLEQAYHGLIKPAPYPPPPYKLLHVVNTALNLVGGDNLAWQQRKAEPFSVSPLHAGCYRLGYRQSRDFGGRATGGISIGTAAAISGAAASSNMGYYTTSPVISLLLTLFNVRLGWWLGNPGPAGHATYGDSAPSNSVLPVVSEAFGMTDDRNPYVYLTDGGHFENLALYEMVLRRCRVIVCSDGAQDEEYRFGDLGNAVRKIRIDLGVPIEFTRVPIYAELPDVKKDGGGFYWAVGKIRYSLVDWGAEDGVLVYVKPAVYGDEPRDILEYKKSFPAFPHQSTGDQFFDEPQFESYRALGSHVMDQICGEQPSTLDLYDVLDRVSKKLTEGLPPADPELARWLPKWLADHRASGKP